MKIKIERELFLNLLKSKEYSPYLVLKKDSSVYIDIVNIPKDHYLTINGSYSDGFILCGIISDALKYVSDEKLLKVSIKQGE